MISSYIHAFFTRQAISASRLITLFCLLVSVLLFAQAIFVPAGTAQAQEETSQQTISTLQPISSELDPSAFPIPDPPTLIEPQDDLFATAESAPPLGVPQLKWSLVPLAKRYRVQVSTSSSFADPIINQITYMNSYTPRDALRDGEYYWRAQAEVDKVWGEYSEVRRFTKAWTEEGRLAPQLITPDDGSSIAIFAPNSFTWTRVSGAAYYNFEISGDESFGAITYSAETVTPQHTPSERLPNNDYFWRVTPIDNQGNNGDPSGTYEFTFDWHNVPELIEPANGSEIPFIPQFSWTAVEAADTYFLELSTDPEFSAPQRYETHQTSWTPEKNLANDQEYYWRVQALDNVGNSSPWSAVRQFQMRWNFQTDLLAPENNSSFLSYPIFQWSPIPGAERYQVQVDESTSFDSPMLDIKTHNSTSATMTQARDAKKFLDADLFWRVRGIDAQDNLTPWSRVSSFRLKDSFGPNLIYPRHYYAPDSENLPQYLENSAEWPLFTWDAVNILRTDGKWGTIQPDYYELTVAADPAFQTINFQMQTTGIAAVPTVDTPFTNPTADQLYYWRVRAYRNGQQLGTDSVWVAKIDDPTEADNATDELTVLYPQDRFEAVETPPLLGWLPVRDASHYRVQISKASTFTGLTILEEAQPTSPNYAPWQGRMANGVHQPMPTGVYWWRVRAEDAQNNSLDLWSEPRRFHVSHNLINGNIRDLIPPLYPASIISTTEQFDPAIARVASNPLPTADQYQIDNLHVMLNRVSLNDETSDWSSLDWILAFEVAETIAEPMLYGVYVDTNHLDGVGATVDPLGKPILAASHFLPDYAIYVTRSANSSTNSIVPADVQIFSWNGSYWSTARTLDAIGGDAWFDAQMSAVQLVLPYTSLGAGDSDFAGSTAFVAFSTSTNSNDGIRGAVPQQSAIIDNPTLVSDMPMPLAPFDSSADHGIAHYQMPTMHWRTESYDSIDGYEIQIARDSEFTDILETVSVYERDSASSYSWLPTAFQTNNAYADNGTYYWRVRVRHESFNPFDRLAFDNSPWSMPMRFTLDSQQVGNPALSTETYARTTPSFSWERVEGVSGYVLQVDTSTDFSRPIINKNVDGISYTPDDAMADETYYWRVAMRRADRVWGRWTETMTFTKRSEIPSLVAPIEGAPVAGQPTFEWSPLLSPAAQPHMAAPRYQLQFAQSPDFTAVGINIPKVFKLDSATFTPNENDSLSDGTWYWRVAVIDADRNVGSYSATQHFEKTYPAPVLLTEKAQLFMPNTISFTWQPMDGAAYYEVQYDDNPAFDSPRTTNTDSTHLAPTDNLAHGVYYWRVRMVDSDRNKGPYAEGEIEVRTQTVFLPVISQ